MVNLRSVKIWLWVGLICLLVFPGSVSGMAVQSNTVATLRVSLLAPLTGPVASFGASAQKGAEMAVDEWNARGGVLSHLVVLDERDSQCNATAAIAAANGVVSDGIHYIIGEVCSSASIPISQIAEAHSIVQVAPASTNPQVTLNNDLTVKQYVFRACFIDPFQGKMMARFAVKQGLKKAFLLHDPGNGYVSGLVDAFRSTYPSVGGTIVGDEPYSSGDTDFSVLIGEIKSSMADVVYLPDYYTFANTFLAQANAAGVTAVFMGGDGWDSPDLNFTLAEGAFYSTSFAVDNPDPALQQWIQGFNAKYGANPDAIAALTYDSTNLLLAAIQAAGVDDPAVVKNVLAARSFTGVTGRIAFDASHNPNKPLIVVQVKNHAPTFFASFAQVPVFMPLVRR